MSTSLDTNMTTAMAYLMTITLMNSCYLNSIGGITFDAGRMLAGIIKFDNETYYRGTWWILMFAPLVGYMLGVLFIWIDVKMAGSSGSDDAKAAETNEAAENA